MGRRMSRLAVVVLATFMACAGVRPADACDACAATTRTLPRPDATWLLTSDTTDVACPSHVYAVRLEAGDTATFTLCDARAPGAGGSYDARLRLWSGACGLLADSDGACAVNLPEITWATGVADTFYLEVTGSTLADIGDYTLASMGTCADADCLSVGADVGVVRTSCRLLDDAVTCRRRTISAALDGGRHYTFSLCDASCPGAGADFDSVIEVLDPSGALVASSDDACGDDGEVSVDTPPGSGTRSYCIRVSSRSGPGAFHLATRVDCAAPTALSLRPGAARADAAGCSVSQPFSVTVDGTPDFTLTWSIAPPPGGSASPSSGGGPVSGGAPRFQSALTGSGTYSVHVEIANECGSVAGDFSFELQDRAGPDLELSALSGCGPHPIVAPRKSLQRELETGPPGAREAEPKSLGCPAPCTVGVLSASHPMYDVFLSCTNASFSAGTGAQHPVTLASGARQNVIFGGAGGNVGTSHAWWRFHELGLTVAPTFGSACLFDPPDTPAEPNSVGIESEWTISPSPGLLVTLREEIVAFGTDETDSGVRLTLGTTSDASSTETATVGVRWEIDYQNGGDDGPWCATVTCEPPEIVEERFTEHEYAGDEIKDFYRIQNNTGTPIFGNFTNTTEISGFPDTGRPDRLMYGRWGTFVNAPWDATAVEGNGGPDGDSAILYWFGALPENGILLLPGTSFSRSMVIFSSNLGADCSGFTPGRVRDAVIEACEGDCVTLGALASDACGGATVTLTSSSAGAPPCLGLPCEVTFPAAGVYTYDWEAADPTGNVTQGTTTVTVRAPPDCLVEPCAVQGIPPATVVAACPGERVILDGSTLSITGCAGVVKYKWRDAAGALVGSNPAIAVTPASTATYELTVSCTADPACATSADVTVQVAQAPLFDGAIAVDPAPCSHGIELSWPAATFFSGGGRYNVFRSEIDCADALLQPALATGLTSLTYTDGMTVPGTTYFYAVQAEDDPPATRCGTPGASQGGPSTASCTAPVADAWDGSPEPSEVWAALRLSHGGQLVTLDVFLARPLLPGEHFHVLKAWGAASGPFTMVNVEGQTARWWSQTDLTNPLQFFDVRIADTCERQSRKEYPVYPNGYDVLW